jgi:hypothetical protein
MWLDAMFAPDPARPDGLKHAGGNLWSYFTRLIDTKRAARHRRGPVTASGHGAETEVS